MTPEALVEAVSTEVLDSIEADPAMRSGNHGRLQRLIDDKVAPYVDFQRMTRLCVGIGWRSAAPEQRQSLVREFRTYAVHTYGGALSRVTDHRVTVRAVRSEPQDTDAYVRTVVAASNGQAIQLDYRLERTPMGWRIYDMTILGISMVETFRNSFTAEVSRNGVEGLLRALAERNERLSTRNEP
jgi:phospholipid transport system substrate-binding protein